MWEADLSKTITYLTDALEHARDPWWIIGSAAVALHGANPGEIADVDVLLSERDARAVFAILGLPIQAGSPDDQFASVLFAAWTKPPLTVEFMAGLSTMQGGLWEQVALTTRETHEVFGRPVFLPSVSELSDLLRRFGRAKDHDRLRALEKRA